MRAQETLYYLEMQSVAELRPPRRVTTDLSLVEQHDVTVIREVTLGIGEPYDWPSQHWDEQRWSEYVARDDLRHWTVHADDQVIGLASLRFAAAEVEIDTFGLLPNCVGRGLGGAALAHVVRLAWQIAPDAGRVWLHTSSEDHEAALPNYLRRGFRLHEQTGASPRETRWPRRRSAPLPKSRG